MGKLSIVATPIGNMEDITLRALRTLKECDVIYAEDTRVISKLLTKYGHRKSVFRLDAATEVKKAEEIIARLEAGEHVVYVSDAGTPGISDPGARLVARAPPKRARPSKRSRALRRLPPRFPLLDSTRTTSPFLAFSHTKKGDRRRLRPSPIARSPLSSMSPRTAF